MITVKTRNKRQAQAVCAKRTRPCHARMPGIERKSRNEITAVIKEMKAAVVLESKIKEQPSCFPGLPKP